MATTETKIEEDVNLDEVKDGSVEEDGVVLKKETKTAAEPQLEIEIVDDIPDADRKVLEARERNKGKKEDDITELPESKDALELEIKDYGKRSQQRIRQLYSKFHDERRAREAATREQEEAIRYAQNVTGELTKTREYLSKGETYLLEQVKKRTELALNEAKRKYEEAYQSGDAAKIADALVAMNDASAEKREADAFKPLQTEKSGVERKSGGEETTVDTTRRAAQQPDPLAVAWAEKNTWFGKDEVMTATAYGLHSSAVKAGIDPRSDEYYSRLDAEMRKRFPEKFEKPEVEKPRAPAPRSIVAGVTRTGPSKKVTLTQTQVSIAKRLGVPLEMYAQQVLKESGA